MALLVFPVPTSLDRAAIVASFPVGKDSIVLQDPPESAGEGWGGVKEYASTQIDWITAEI